LKNSYLTLFTGSVLLSSMLLTGCGGTVQTDNAVNANTMQPHQVISRTTANENNDDSIVSNDYADNWQEYVSMTSTYDRSHNNTDNFSLNIKCEKGISSDVAHFQIFVDTDNNKATGLSIGEGAYAIEGADYMIEDGTLYKSSSNTDWQWEYVNELTYQTQEEANNAYSIRISSSAEEITSIFDVDNLKQMNISIEPISAEWYDTHNFVSTQNIALNVIGDKEVVEPVVPVEPIVPQKPEEPTATLYEDAENGLSNGWTTVLGEFQPQRKTPGYKNESQAFVKLQTNWTQNNQGLWNNSAEYHLELDNTEQTILSIDLVGDGLVMEHYVLGVKVSTNQGERTLLWDSYYNHQNIPASQRTLSDGSRYMVFPAPLEMVRGYDYSDVTLSENFTVDLEAALKYFEPENSILSVDTLVATGGNLDNIKLLSN